MRSVFLLPFLIALALTGPAGAGAFEDGQAAYQKGDYASALGFWRPLADDGDANAQFGMAVSHDLGRGVAQDHAAAVLWYRKAADLGHANAQHNLASLYDEGLGVEPDYATAAALVWFRRAAAQGYAASQCSLGVMYALGRGLRRDDIEAYKWLTLALAAYAPTQTEQRDQAKKNRDLVALRLTPHQMAQAERHARDFQSNPEPSLSRP